MDTSVHDKAVSDLMTRTVESVSPATSIADAARLMERFDVGGLPVEDGDRIVGFVTDRDIVLRGVSRDANSRTTEVRDVMTPRAISVPEDSGIETAFGIMREQAVRRLMVVDHENRLVGVLSLCDVAARGLGKEALALLKTICVNT